jgi:curved DNA-binding protein
MDFVDYYKLLGVDKTATLKEIKAAYRRLARKYHPDLNPNDKDAKRKFQEINEANEVLSDPERRKKYDQYGKDWQHSEQFEEQKKQQHHRQHADSRRTRFAGSQDEGYFSDFFESLFGGTTSAGRSRQVKFRGEDYTAELQLGLTDAYKTSKQTLNVNGEKIRITIPAGMENGQTIKIAGRGGKGINGGPDGDLYITFSIADHPGFKRMGNDLYTTIDLDLFTSVLGGEITIDTLDGKVKLKVMPETQNGSKVKLKGKGFPAYRNEDRFGDLYVTYSVKIPTGLTEKQRTLFKQLSELKRNNETYGNRIPGGN